MSAYDIIIRPIITEKTNLQNAQENKIAFEVKKGANKTAVAQAIEQIYGIKPVKVNILNVHPKTKRMGNRGQFIGKTNAVRKAVVTLPEGQNINLFD